MPEFNLKTAIAEFKARKKANKNKTQVDNSRLHAGSPMYYYCRECGELAGVLPESHTCAPPRRCDPCALLGENNYDFT